MSKIKLRLTEDHYKLISSQIIEVIKFQEEFGETIIVPLPLEFELPNSWRADIENAPRDGSAILALIIYTADGHVRPETIEYDSGGWWRGYAELEEYKITHWMEIPELPK